MTGRYPNKFIIGMVMLAMMLSFFTMTCVSAGERALSTEGQHICTCEGDCTNSESGNSCGCMDMPDSNGCGCTITSMPDTEGTPSIVPVTSRDSGIDVLVSVLPLQYELVEQPKLTWAVTTEEIVYEIHYYSSLASRAPPA